MNFREYLNEAKIPKLPAGIKASYLNKAAGIEYKEIDVIDMDELAIANIWKGFSGKKGNLKPTIILSSYDFGFEPKIKSGTETEINNIYNKLNNRIQYDDMLKLMK